MSELPTQDPICTQRGFAFTNIKAGWVDAEIQLSGGPQVIDASYLSDAIRDFVDALASLATARTANCKWEEEPGHLEWDFERSGDLLKVTVSSGLHTERRACFECAYAYERFWKDVLDSLNDLKNGYGPAKFEEEWGYPFPAEAALKLENALASQANSELA